MAFSLTIPRTNGTTLQLALSAGDRLFLLGANGTGKSSLMHRIYSTHRGMARHVSAHRQNWFQAGELTLSSQQKRQIEAHILKADQQPHARWRDDYSGQRTEIPLYDLVASENVRARAIARAYDDDSLDGPNAFSKRSAPLAQLNELLALAGIPVKIVIRDGEEVRAVRNDGAEYGVPELSDGERNALLVTANVLTAKAGALVLIDEPERHLHRSIISPLLSSLFALRSDCAFVVSTHEVMLPVDNPHAHTILVRSCVYSNSVASAWDVDLIPRGADIDDDIRRDILGARRIVLFVEGTPESLDRALYSLLFPSTSVIAKNTCRDVEHAVIGIRAGESLHHVKAFGIIDGDGRPEEDVARLASAGVFALPLYSVESIYYHPLVQRLVAERHCDVVGASVDSVLAAAVDAVVRAVAPHADRLADRVAEKTVRDVVFRCAPKREHIAEKKPISIVVDVADVVAAERQRLTDALADRDVTTVISRYPVRETPALQAISRCIGFQDRQQYESAVRKLLIDSSEAIHAVRSLFGPLTGELAVA